MQFLFLLCGTLESGGKFFARHALALREVVVLSVVTDNRPAVGYLQECDGDFRIIPTGSASTRYLMEGSNNLATWWTLWSGLPTTGTYEFLVTPELTFQHYRARVVP